MEKQENLRDCHGKAPELSFYASLMTPHAGPILVFKDEKDGFWKARHYTSRETLDLKLTQRGFENFKKTTDNEIQELITHYNLKSRNLKADLETKKELSELEEKAKSTQELK
ncbi:MAG: hypothetical protein Q8N63_00250 [Nanoarchaeota archaeon]|nr:hypothetical protein [Nanoarchaeota archaeon]